MRIAIVVYLEREEAKDPFINVVFLEGGVAGFIYWRGFSFLLLLGSFLALFSGLLLAELR